MSEEQELQTTCKDCGDVYVIKVSQPLEVTLVLNNCPACDLWDFVVEAARTLANKQYRDDRLRVSSGAAELLRAVEDYTEIGS